MFLSDLFVYLDTFLSQLSKKQDMIINSQRTFATIQIWYMKQVPITN